MAVALCLLFVVVAFVLVWRGFDVRFVLFAAALAIGAIAGQPQLVFRKTVETLADGKFLLPICAAMGFAYVVRDTGAVAALVHVLVRPIERAPRIFVPAASFVALVVNMAIPSQTSTLAAVGPIDVALMARVRVRAPDAGTVLVYGASVAGALVNPGVAEVITLSALTKTPAPVLVLALLPGVLAAFAVGMTVLLVRRRFGLGKDDPEIETSTNADNEEEPKRWKALLPPLPIFWLLLAHPSLPTAALIAKVVPEKLEVLTAMLAGTVITIAIAGRDRQRSIRAFFEGMGWALANIVSIIAVSTGVAKALEVAGVLSAFVALVSGHSGIALGAAFLLAFLLAMVSGSGTAPSVALVTALGPRAEELGVNPLVLGGVILFGAEAGRTTSPVSAVLLFGATLVGVKTKTLVVRLLLPCFVAGIAGALWCALR